MILDSRSAENPETGRAPLDQPKEPARQTQLSRIDQLLGSSSDSSLTSFHTLTHYLNLYVSAVKLDDVYLQNRAIDCVRACYRATGRNPSAFRVEAVFSELASESINGSPKGGNKMNQFLLEALAWRYLYGEDSTVQASRSKLEVEELQTALEDTPAKPVAHQLNEVVKDHRRRGSGSKPVPYGWTILPSEHPSNNLSPDLQSAHILHDPAFSSIDEGDELDKALSEVSSISRKSSVYSLNQVLPSDNTQTQGLSERRKSEDSAARSNILEDPAFSTVPRFLRLTEEPKERTDESPTGKARQEKASRSHVQFAPGVEKTVLQPSVQRMLVDNPSVALGLIEALIRVARKGREDGDPRTDEDSAWHIDEKSEQVKIAQ